MKSIKIGKHAIPVWLIPVILISMIGVTVGYYVWTTLTIPFEVKEPLEVLNYPSHLSLYAGDTLEFNITLMNHASANYSVDLIFQLSNATYQANYVTLSYSMYFVVPGVQNVTATLTVAPDAPPVSSSLTISLARFAPQPPTDQWNVASMSFVGTKSGQYNKINMTIQNTGSSSWTLTQMAQVNWATGLPVSAVGNGGALNCSNGKQIAIQIAMTTTSGNCTSGNQYTAVLLLTDGNKIWYVMRAPSQQESLYMSNLHIWFNTTSQWAEAAFAIVNTGGTDAVLQSITARSQPSDWSNVYYWTTSTATISVLGPTSTQPNGSTISPPINGTAQNLNVASGAITLKSGYTVVIYINHPDSVGQNDIGTPIAVTVFTANAQWTQETNVQAVQ